MRVLVFILTVFAITPSWSFSWQDLWYTPNQQAQALMQKGQYKKAGELFDQKDWQATAAYRGGNYQQAAQAYRSLKNEMGYYNAGNALAHMGKYEDALKAYDEALKMNPVNQDAKFNRRLVADLLKKEQEKQEKKDQNGAENKQNQQQDQNKQQQNQQGQGQDSKENQKNNNQQNGQPQKQENKQSDNSGSDEKKKEESAKEEQQSDKNTSSSEKEDKQKKSQNDAMNAEDKADQQSAAQSQSSLSDKEQQQANEQWLKLIPDDPGGLLREKFLRDHIRRQRGWYQ